eukprot:386297_1
MSGCKGDNLASKSENMKWYKGFTENVKKEKVIGPPKRASNKVFRMSVSGVYKIKGVGNGRVEQGSVEPGVTVKFNPSRSGGKAFKCIIKM